ncbi:MAG: 4Fe-4S dicluster domain-containing protein [Candidatus Lokiarchaeota archaeon]|nr:4Fe-4S dicluster domain-containing protein [Candidatus Lokiarchaeota archaeon]
MPIDKEFRKRWNCTGEHSGHPVWVSPDGSECIHGKTAGVHLASCNGCMKCVPACPTKVFSVWLSPDHGRVVDPVRDADCILCLVCEVVCPRNAIHIERESGSSETLDSLLRGA